MGNWSPRSGWRVALSAAAERAATEAKLLYCAFDLIVADGEDLRALPLLDRKKRLKTILPHHSLIAFSRHRNGTGKKFFAEAERKVSKASWRSVVIARTLLAKRCWRQPARDFRTWAGTILAALALAELSTARPKANATSSSHREVGEAAWQHSGHLSQELRAPEILSAYMSGDLVKMIEAKIARKFKRQYPQLTADEVRVLAFYASA